MDHSSQRAEIGFKVDPNGLLSAKENECDKAKLFDGYSFATENGCELPSCQSLICGYRYKDVHPDTLIPDFSVIDFDKQPMHCCASFML